MRSTTYECPRCGSDLEHRGAVCRACNPPARKGASYECARCGKARARADEACPDCGDGAFLTAGELVRALAARVTVLERKLKALEKRIEGGPR